MYLLQCFIDFFFGMSVAMFSLIGKVIVWMAVFQNVGVGYAAVGMDNKMGVGKTMQPKQRIQLPIVLLSSCLTFASFVLPIQITGNQKALFLILPQGTHLCKHANFETITPTDVGATVLMSEFFIGDALGSQSLLQQVELLTFVDNAGGDVDFVNIFLLHSFQLFGEAGVGQLIGLTAIAVEVGGELHFLPFVLSEVFLTVIEAAEAGRTCADPSGFLAVQNGNFLDIHLCSLRFDNSVFNDIDAVTNSVAETAVVGNENVGSSVFLLVFPKHLDHLCLGDDIQHAGGLIQDDNLRLHDQQSGKCRPLQFTSGKLRRLAVEVLFMKAEFLDILNQNIRGVWKPIELVGFFQAGNQRQRWIERNLRVLKENLDILSCFPTEWITDFLFLEKDFPGGWLQQTGEHLTQG